MMILVRVAPKECKKLCDLSAFESHILVASRRKPKARCSICANYRREAAPQLQAGSATMDQIAAIDNLIGTLFIPDARSAVPEKADSMYLCS